MEIIVLLVLILGVYYYRLKKVKVINQTHIATVESVKRKHVTDLRVSTLIKFYKFTSLLSDGLIAYYHKQKIVSIVIVDLVATEITADITVIDDRNIEQIHTVLLISLFQKEDIKCRVNNVLVSLGFVLHTAESDPELINRWIYTTEFANSIRNDIAIKKQSGAAGCRTH